MKEASLENSFSFISIRWDQTFDTISAPSMDTSSSYISSIYCNEKKNQLQHGSLYILYIEFDLEKKEKLLIPRVVLYEKNQSLGRLQSSLFSL